MPWLIGIVLVSLTVLYTSEDIKDTAESAERTTNVAFIGFAIWLAWRMGWFDAKAWTR